MNVFLLAGVAMILLAAGLVAAPLLRRGWRSHGLAAVLMVLTIPVATFLVYGMVSNYEWNPAAQAVGNPAGTPEAGSLPAAVATLEARLRENPGDEEGWLLLGSSYINLGRPADASKAFERALGLSNGANTVARLNLAEAQVLMNPEALTGAAGQEIEAIIAAEPRNPKALWYAGLRALAVGNGDAARTRWSTLLELNPPERIRQIIEGQLRELAGAGTLAAADRTAPPAGVVSGTALPSGATSISLELSLSPELQPQVPADAPLFVFVRDPARPGPPLAVVRRRAGDLPVRLQISDADMMLPGTTLGSLKKARVVARIAKGGDPVARAGDIFGEAGWSAGRDGPVPIVINQVVEP